MFSLNIKFLHLWVQNVFGIEISFQISCKRVEDMFLLFLYIPLTSYVF